jgi:alpha-ribazole phosphatase
MSGRIVLVRHPPVAKHWSNRCYGQSDVRWSHEGRRLARELVREIAAKRPQLVVHSGLRRTRELAQALARLCGAAVHVDRRWRERDFGDWEGRTWHSIWRNSGAAMDRMVTEPCTFRPGGGETTAELVRRAVAAWNDVPTSGSVAVIAHGGPIAAVRCRLAGSPMSEIIQHVPRCGEIVEVNWARLRFTLVQADVLPQQHPTTSGP